VAFPDGLIASSNIIGPAIDGRAASMIFDSTDMPVVLTHLSRLANCLARWAASALTIAALGSVTAEAQPNARLADYLKQVQLADIFSGCRSDRAD
jgi:hypothetical protein